MQDPTLLQKITGLLGSPVVQGLAGAAALGANPLLGLLAVPGLQDSREQALLANQAARDDLLRRKRRVDAEQELRGLLSDQTTVQDPSTTFALSGLDSVQFANIPGRRHSIPTAQTPQGQQRVLGLLGDIAPQAVAEGLLSRSLPTQPPKFSTDTGKLFQDLELAEQQGNFKAARALRDEIERGTSPTAKFGDIRSARNDVIRNSQDFVDARAGFERVESGFSASNAVGDLAGIFGFMKVLDPGSTVREGEFSNAENAGGVPDRIRAAYNRLLTGERLTPEQRVQFRTQARSQFSNVTKSQNRLIDDARKFAERNGLRISDVVPEFVIPTELPQLPASNGPNRSTSQPLTPTESAELDRLRRKFKFGG